MSGFRIVASLLALAAAEEAFHTPAMAAFVEAPEITLTTSQHHGITFDGTNWYIANIFAGGLHRYAANFAYLNDVSLFTSNDTRGLTRSPTPGKLLVGDYGSGVVREYDTTAGTSTVAFSGVASVNTLALDTSDNTLWVGFFNGVVQHRQTNGALLGSFTMPLAVTGLAYDPVSDHLLVLEDNDSIYEAKTDGTDLHVVIAGDQLTGNGQDMYYDSTLGRLYATSQENTVSIFNDAARVPEPTAGLLLAAPVVMLRRRSRA
jgi:hypothetical protein